MTLKKKNPSKDNQILTKGFSHIKKYKILKEQDSKLESQSTILICAIVRHRKLKVCQANAAKSGALRLILVFSELSTKTLKIKRTCYNEKVYNP